MPSKLELIIVQLGRLLFLSLDELPHSKSRGFLMYEVVTFVQLHVLYTPAFILNSFKLSRSFFIVVYFALKILRVVLW